MAKTKIIVAGKIDKVGLKKVGIGLLIGAAGYLVTFLADIPQAYDFGEYTTIVAIACAGLVNFLRKKLLPYESK